MDRTRGALMCAWRAAPRTILTRCRRDGKTPLRWGRACECGRRVHARRSNSRMHAGRQHPGDIGTDRYRGSSMRVFVCAGGPGGYRRLGDRSVGSACEQTGFRLPDMLDAHAALRAICMPNGSRDGDRWESCEKDASAGARTARMAGMNWRERRRVSRAPSLKIACAIRVTE